RKATTPLLRLAVPQTSKWKRLALSASSRSPDLGWTEVGSACHDIGGKRGAIALNYEFVRRLQDEPDGRIELAEERLVRMMRALLSVDEGETYIVSTTGGAQAPSRLWSRYGAFRKVEGLAQSTICTTSFGTEGHGVVYASLAKINGENAEPAITRLFDNVRN